MFGSIAKALSGSGVKSNVGLPASGVIPPLGSVPSASGLLVSQSTAMTNSTVFRCISLIARDVARCRPSLVRIEDGVDVPVPAGKHPVAKLLRKPNRVQTWFEFSEQLTAARKLRGNGYAAILRDRRGNPNELIAINPDAVMMLEASDGSLFYNTNRLGLFQIAALRDLPISIPAEDMLHFRDLSFNMLLGASTVGLARDEIALAMGQTQQASRFIGNGARPSGVLKSPKMLTEEAAKRLKKSWTDLVSGVQNAGGTAVLEDGIEWMPMQLTSVDLEFDASRDRQVYEIARYFGVPPHKLGIKDANKTIDPLKGDQQYINEVVQPELDRMAERLEDTFGLDDEGYAIRFDTSRLYKADVKTTFDSYRTGVLSGLITVNEARAAIGKPPVEGGDRLLVPSNTAALGSDMTGAAPDGAGRPESGSMPDPGVPTGGDQPGAEPLKE